MSRIQSKPPTFRLINLERMNYSLRHGRHTSLDKQNYSFAIQNKENLVQKVECEQKAQNKPGVIEKNLGNSSKFCRRLEQVEVLLEEHYKNAGKIRTGCVLFKQ